MANSGSTSASGTQWKARSHAAYHGYSHLSGMEMTSALLRWRHSWLRPSLRPSGGGGSAGSPSSQRSTSKWKNCLVHSIPASAWRSTRASSSLDAGGRERGVELVGLALALGHDLAPTPLSTPAPSADRRSRTSAVSPGRHREAVPEGGLGARAVGVDRRPRPCTTWSAMPSFGKAGPSVPHSRCGVRLVLAEQRLGRAVTDEHHAAEVVVLGHQRAVLVDDDRLAVVKTPRPGVAEPQRRQDVERGLVRAGVADPHADADVVGAGLGVVDGDVPVAIVVEDAGVEQLELGVVPAAGPVLARPGARRGTRCCG